MPLFAILLYAFQLHYLFQEFNNASVESLFMDSIRDEWLDIEKNAT